MEDSSDDVNDLEASDGDFDFVLLSSSGKPCHPPSEDIHMLWQIFVEGVDPLTKVVHVPSIQQAIQKAASDTTNIPRSFEALMFAIYGAAVMSLKDADCQQKFREPRKTLLSRYTSGTRAALSRAKFMGTTSLVVLQALVLHLLSVRHVYEPRAVWSLTGVAVRIAQSLGLERDGIHSALPPFETEMRRRIWWELKMHDFHTAELCGLAKFRDLDTGFESTKWPTNVNDDQLYPGMPSLPVASNGLTDIVFIALRCELTSWAVQRVARFREQGICPNQWVLNALGGEMKQVFGEIEEVIEKKYVGLCDPSRDLHLLTMLMARSAINVVRFLTSHPRRWTSIEQTPPSERQFVWECSIQLLEQHNMVQSSPQLKRFAWQ